MQRKLFVVQETFSFSGRGIVVPSDLPRDTFGKNGASHFVQVGIKCPDGRAFTAEAQFYIPHFSTIGAEDLERALELNQRAGYDCVLIGLQREEIPIGSEIYEQDFR